MFCTNCGKELPDNAVFCTDCGCKITIAHIDAPQPQTCSITFQDKKKNIIATQNVQKGENVVPPVPPDKKGYKFVRWNPSVDTAKEDQVYTAIYKKKFPILAFCLVLAVLVAVPFLT